MSDDLKVTIREVNKFSYMNRKKYSIEKFLEDCRIKFEFGDLLKPADYIRRIAYVQSTT